MRLHMRLPAVLLSLTLLFSPAQGFQPPESVYNAVRPLFTGLSWVHTAAPLATAAGDVTSVYYSDGGIDVNVRQFPNGDVFLQCRADAADTRSVLLDGSACQVRRCTGGKWVVTDCVQNARDTLYITVTGGVQSYSLIVNPPLAYRSLSHDCIEALPYYTGGATVMTEYGGVRLTLNAPACNGYAAWFVLISAQPLIDWNDPVIPRIWTNYSFSAQSRWTPAGYYYTVPKDYTPTGANVYEHTPALYVPVALALTGGSRAADDLATVMLDTSRAYYNNLGYFPTAAQSNWLMRDYGIGAGFYDSRFNADTARAYLTLGRRLGISAFTDVADRFAQFLVPFSDSHSFLFFGGTGFGRLTQDYYHPDGGKPTHVALNHQLAEILFLYQHGSAASVRVADAMLRGIKFNRDGWIMDDGNLHYAYLPDDSFGLKDYDYLTYNDLYALQNELMRIKGVRDLDLDILMRSKLWWMRKNDITGYNE